MANDYFQFKQFTVHQQRAAMRVCTDACIQGAYTARYLRTSPPARVLDIGAGTGLLSLMLAQAIPAPIDAIELDADAFAQAGENFAASPWAQRLQVIHADARQFNAARPYPFIITNPPFFINALKSGKAARNTAMHATELDFAALAAAIDVNLSADGACSVLLPYDAFEQFRVLAANKGLELAIKLDVQQSPRHGFFRTVGIFKRGAVNTEMETLLIYDAQNQYTPDFVALLKEYYLYL
ncbi:methyltransferase [Chitinophaga horti]|uniref:tRNA1(Val) (adenine(37)-N6)-methyltransferase n=1 Tax=Chitinophaga horti TaxID=2920382 RepID=A0ABY6J5E9_9BACT|nr:methyltransferase [Chitinophaga horti]UYQ94910.1 methyltransferase [Chitinophaga horti]